MAIPIVFDGIAQLTDGDWNGDPNDFTPINPDLSDEFTVDLQFAANGWSGTLSLAIVGDLNSTDETLTVEITGQDTTILFDGDAGNNGPFLGGVQTSSFGAQPAEGDVAIDGEQGRAGAAGDFSQATIDKMGEDDEDNLATFTFEGAPDSVLTGEFDLSDATDIEFTISPETPGGGRGVDFAQIEWTLTATPNTLTFGSAISNFVAYLDCDDDGSAETKVKLDEWSNLEDFDIEVEELDVADVEDWLVDAVDGEFSDCDLLALTVKIGGPPNPDFGPGEGDLVFGTVDEIGPGVATATVPDDNTVDMTFDIYDAYFA
jgi:hypothetical protein